METQIVIVGGGVAGLIALKALDKPLRGRARITLIDSKPQYEYHPGFFYMIAGKVVAEQLTFDLAEFCAEYGVNFVCASVTSLDRDRRVVLTVEGEYTYNLLFLAPGIFPDLAQIPGAAEHALHLKDLADAHAIAAIGECLPAART